MRKVKQVVGLGCKAQGANTLRILILMLIVAIILIIFANNIVKNLGHDIPREVCRASVLAKYGTRMPKVHTESPLDLQCFTQIVNVRKNGIYKTYYNGIERREVRLEKFNTGDDSDDIKKKIRKVMAGEMYDCWYQFHRGQYDIFGDWAGSTTSGVSRCIICSEINFDESLSKSKLSDEPALTGLTDYPVSYTHLTLPTN